MSSTAVIAVILVLAMIAANLPWFSERFFLVFKPLGGRKREWMRLAEWLLMFFLIGGIGLGFERKAQGTIHAQDWEFYVVSICLFIVFAVPGFVFRHQLGKMLTRRRR